MAERLTYASEIVPRVRRTSGAARLYASLDVLHQTWLLIEQLRKAYETIAGHVDTRFVGQRKSLDARLGNPRSPEQQDTYHSRVWLYPAIDIVPDSAFLRLGLDPAKSREVLRGIASRSAERLATEEAELREYYDRYSPVCSAYKHGRTVFAMQPTVSMTSADEGTIHMTASPTIATILVAEQPGAPPHAFLTITPDDEFWKEVHRVLVILETQVPRLLSFVDAFVATNEAALRRIESGSRGPLPSIPFWEFADPYSDAELELLDALKRHGLRLYESTTPDDRTGQDALDS
ncbi:MAG TPA: hypothetical protein VF698_07300 [Thermoanaerobaculia bacterium]